MQPPVMTLQRVLLSFDREDSKSSGQDCWVKNPQSFGVIVAFSHAPLRFQAQATAPQTRDDAPVLEPLPAPRCPCTCEGISQGLIA